MISRRIFFGAAAGAIALAAFAGTQFAGGVSPAIAADKQSYSAASFKAAQDANKSILVDIAASWCPTCKRQKAILTDLTTKDKYKDLVIFEVDYDSQRDVVREFGAFRQSTLIAFKGKVEVDRSVADTRASSIEAMLDLTI